MVAEDCVSEEIVDELLRRVLDHGDLFEDDLALGVELDESRREDHVRHHVERLFHVLVEDPRVDDRVVTRGGRVQLTAEGVEDLRDLERRVLLGALEEQVLEEVRDARVRAVLVAGARADPEPDGDGADAVQRLADHPRAACERRQQVVLHARIVDLCLRRACRRGRGRRRRARGARSP
jgi:hypothetical protein